MEGQNNNFLSYAHQLKEKGEFREAFHQAKCALSVDPHNPQIVALMKDLALLSMDNSSNTVKTLIDNLSLRKDEITCLESLISLLHSNAVAVQDFESTDTVKVLFEYLSSPSSKDELVLNLIKDLCKVSKIISYQTLSLLTKTPSILNEFIEYRSEKSFSLVLNILVILFDNEKIDSSTKLVLFNASVSIIDNFSTLSPSSQRLLFQLLALMLSDSGLANHFLQNRGYLVSFLICSSFEGMRNIIAAVLAKTYEMTNTQASKDHFPLFQKFISDLFYSTNSDRTTALTSLICLLQANINFGIQLLNDPIINEEMHDIFTIQNDTFHCLAIEILTLALNDPTSRKTISQEFNEEIKKSSESGSESLKMLVSSFQIKLSSFPNKDESSVSIDQKKSQLLYILESLSIQKDEQTLENMIESLVYLSSIPELKEIISTPPISKSFMEFCKSTLIKKYGILIILSNIISYRKPSSDQEEEYKKLKEISGDPLPKDHKLDDSEYVDIRSKNMIQSGIISLLVSIGNDINESIKERVASLFIELSTCQSNRGQLVQQGATKLLIRIAQGTGNSSLLASHALAKIAISVNPSIAFPGQRATELIRPLIKLLKGADELCQFEALLALTNLSSIGSETRQCIVNAKGISAFETLRLSDNLLIQRASNEALCNMVYEPQVYEWYIKDSEASGQQIRLFVLFCDSEDLETRIASSGSLAILTTSEPICRVIQKLENGLFILLKLIEDDDQGLVHRGIEIIKNLVRYEDIAKLIFDLNGYFIIKESIQFDNEDISYPAKEALVNLYPFTGKDES